MKFILLLAIPVLLGETCNNKKKETSSIPSCIQQQIDSLKSRPLQNPPAEVNEYEYNGKRVFLFNSPCCDQFNKLYDESCKYICAPSGGFTGKGDGQCPDFDKTAKHIRLVWKDDRK